MKKTLLLAAFLMLAGSVSAQRYFFGPRSDYFFNGDDFFKFKSGIEAGVSIANTSSKSSDFSTGAVAGFNSGFTFDVGLAYPFLSFSPEILYSQKGYTATTINGNLTQRSQFIDLPLLARFSINPVISFYVGPQFSFLTSFKNTYDPGFVTANETYYEQYSSKVYFDGVVGVSFNMSKRVDLRLRYSVDLQQNYANGNSYVPGYSNQVLQFGLGYKF